MAAQLTAVFLTSLIATYVCMAKIWSLEWEYKQCVQCQFHLVKRKSVYYFLNMDMPLSQPWTCIWGKSLNDGRESTLKGIGFPHVNTTGPLPYTIHEYKCQMYQRHKCHDTELQKLLGKKHTLWSPDQKGFLNKTQKQKFKGKDWKFDNIRL